MKLRGTFPVLCTPFGPDGQIVEADFLRVIDFALACGADGCVYPGVASEVETLTTDERAGLVALLGRHLSGRRPFIVGASASRVEDVRAHIATGAAAGARAAMVMAPASIGASVPDQIAFFQAIGAGVDLPLMLQNAPAPTGAGLAPDAVAAVAAAVPAIRYVKEETLPCGQNMSRIIAGCDGSIEGIFGGAGGRYITDELARGALGTMPAVELTDLHVRLVNAWNAGDTGLARRLYLLSLPALSFQAIFRMHMTKETLRRRGVILATHVRGKGPQMDPGDLRELAQHLTHVAPELTTFPLNDELAAE